MRSATALRLVCVLSLCGWMARCGLGAQAAVSVKDARGRLVTLASPPKRIVSLAPGTTEMLFALGLGNRIVGVTSYCNFPSAATRLPKIGDVNTSIEKVVARRPDLVVASASGNRKALERLDAIKSRKITTFAVDPNTFEELYRDLERLGRITGAAREAQELIASMRKRESAVRARVARLPRVRVLAIAQVEPLWVIGPGTFVHDVIERAGGVNVVGDTQKGYHVFSVEEALLRKPDAVLIGKEGAARLRAHPAWRAVPAVRDNRLYALDPDILARPGPRLVEALEQLASLLHPASKR